MRKVFVFVVLLVAVGLLAGIAVAADDQVTMVDTSQYKINPPYRIGFDIYWLGNSWSVQFAEEFKYEASKHPEIGELIVTDSQGQVAKQVASLEDLIAQDVDIIVVTPLSESALVPVVQKAVDRGIPVICNGGFVYNEALAKLVVTQVSVDDYDFGRVGAEWLVEALGGEGKIIALSGMPGMLTTDLRWAGATSIFDQYPGIEVLTREYADWAYPKAKSIMASLLPAFPEIDGVWSSGAAMTRGVIEAFEEAARNLVPMTGEDNNGFLKMWQERLDEGFDSIAPTKPTYIGAEACLAALKVLNGEPVPSQIKFDPPVITSETLDKFVRLDLPDSFWARTRLPEDIIRSLFGGD